MSTRRLVLLGSTGSIGVSTLDVVKAHPGSFEVLALAAHSNAALLAEQCHQFQPQYACLVRPDRADELKQALRDCRTEIVVGEEALIDLARLGKADLVVNAVVGAAGLRASVETVMAGTDLALANKESMVAGGPLFPSIQKKSGARILPIDSEHSAIWQALNCGRKDEVRRLILTTSGGPFRTMPQEKFSEITVEMALDHPTWQMGPKITIDSSTLANKGLEVIEAVALFQVPVEQVSVVVHPQSMIHSMVEFTDSSVMAQISSPDMRLPITCALFWPDRVVSDFGHVDFEKSMIWTFEPPDLTRFPALRIAFEVAAVGGTAPAIFNAANEIAVDAFLNKKIEYRQIPELIERSVDTINVVSEPNLPDILEADRLTRQTALEYVR